MLVPLANLISLWVLAFKEWPALRGPVRGATTTMDLRKLIIDDIEIEVDPRLTLLQACEQAGVEIPRFCYHERLSHRRQLPDVPGRGGRRAAEADGVLRDAGEGHAPGAGGPAAAGSRPPRRW